MQLHLLVFDLYSSSSVHDVSVIIELLQQHLQGTHAYEVHCPFDWYCELYLLTLVKALQQDKASLVTVPCQLPVSGRPMQRFLKFRLASHGLSIVTGRFSGGQHVDRANRICVHCGGLSIADELHMVHECPALQPLRQRYAPWFFHTN